jgi:hypothetical protein
MTRLLGDHGQREQAELAVVERPAAAALAGKQAVAAVSVPAETAILRGLGFVETAV